MSRPTVLASATLDAWLSEWAQWRIVDDHLVRELRTLDYPSSVRIIAAQVELAERLDHHPIVLLGYCSVRFELWTHDRGALTQLDLDYAQGLDEIIERDFSSNLA